MGRRKHQTVTKRIEMQADFGHNLSLSAVLLLYPSGLTADSCYYSSWIFSARSGCGALSYFLYTSDPSVWTIDTYRGLLVHGIIIPWHMGHGLLYGFDPYRTPVNQFNYLLLSESGLPLQLCLVSFGRFTQISLWTRIRKRFHARSHQYSWAVLLLLVGSTVETLPFTFCACILVYPENRRKSERLPLIKVFKP